MRYENDVDSREEARDVSALPRSVRRLVHHPLCPFSRTVRLVLAEKEIPVDLIEEPVGERRPQLLRLPPPRPAGLPGGRRGQLVERRSWPTALGRSWRVRGCGPPRSRSWPACCRRSVAWRPWRIGRPPAGGGPWRARRRWRQKGCSRSLFRRATGESDTQNADERLHGLVVY